MAKRVGERDRVGPDLVEDRKEPLFYRLHIVCREVGHPVDAVLAELHEQLKLEEPPKSCEHLFVCDRVLKRLEVVACHDVGRVAERGLVGEDGAAVGALVKGHPPGLAAGEAGL